MARLCIDPSDSLELGKQREILNKTKKSWHLFMLLQSSLGAKKSHENVILRSLVYVSALTDGQVRKISCPPVAKRVINLPYDTIEWNYSL